MSEAQNPLIGRTIVAVALASDRKAMKFDLAEGEPVIVKADGDCCSMTWIESLDTPGLLIGGVVTEVTDIEMPFEASYDGYGELTQFYGCMITTSKGQCVIDYRNASNGYYGGNLSWPHNDYYGGVHGQNISTEQWVQVAP